MVRLDKKMLNFFMYLLMDTLKLKWQWGKVKFTIF